MSSGNKLNLGKLGEDTFSLWCTEAELVSNRSHDEDATGWDHLVEFPYIESNKPKDTWGAPIECKVQVKSTQRKDRRLSIKSSVLKRLIDYSYPAFILFLEFNKKNKLENSFLVHVDEGMIEKVLKEIRKNSISPTQKELYKLKISIGYGLENRLPENTGLNFKEAICRFIPNLDIYKYQENKRNIINRAGYGPFNFQVKFSATPNDLNDLIFQNVLKRSNKLKVNDFTIFENRFNLPNGEQILQSCQPGDLLVTPNIIDRCNLYIKSSEHAPAMIFKAEVFSLPNITVQGGGFLIFRSYTFSLIIDLHNNNYDTCTIKLIQDQFTSVLVLVKTLKSLRLLHNNKDVFLGVDFKGYRQLTINFVKSNINSQIFNIIEPLENIIYKFELGSEHETTFDYLASNYKTIIAISRIITNNTTDMVFTDSSITDEDITHLDIPYFRYIELNNIIIGVSCFIQTEKISENNFSVTNFTNVDCFMFLNKSELDEYIQKLNDRLKKNGKKHT